MTRGESKIDILVPAGLAENSESLRTASGAVGLAAPGLAGLGDRSEQVPVTVAGRVGQINRPTLLASLVMKASTLKIIGIDHRKHVEDFLVLASLVRPSDYLDRADATDRRLLSNMLARASSSPALQSIDDAHDGLDRIRMALAAPVPEKPARSMTPPASWKTARR